MRLRKKKVRRPPLHLCVECGVAIKRLPAQALLENGTVLQFHWRCYDAWFERTVGKLRRRRWR